MSDNTTLNTGLGGDVIATDDIGGVKHQRVKVEFGADGAATDVSATSPLPAQERKPGTPAVTSVAASASNVTLLAANANRIAASIFNDSSSALYVKHGATASTSSFTVKVLAGGFYELPHPSYTGIIDGIWDSATGNARVTEAT